MTDFSASFKANAGVKDIVGRGLIYDDNIAIIELVKNAKDAGSASVDITFKNIALDDESLASEIIISDSGSGMTIGDLKTKWLNIAYSEKRGVSIGKRAYAGNKGVGRFSCDRLGKELTLYTKSKDGDYIKLPINWELFENKGQDDEISTIILEGKKLEKDKFLEEISTNTFQNGTVLKIKHLRSDWQAQKIKKLISELEKFSPSLDSDFEVFIYSDTDYNDRLLRKKINSKINNGILDKLVFKTTYIKSTIDSSGKNITTELFFQGQRVYLYKATNPYKFIKNIKIEIHYLDTLSKSYFTKNIGVSPNSYGSVFLFYNGFRISPYGNEKNDWLGLDQRKSQGTGRFLGTRDIFGRIDISDSTEDFSVITSREGLAHNAAFYDLIAYDVDEKTLLKNGKKDYGYVTTIIRQLENFVVSGLDWNRLVDKLGKLKVISADDAKKDPDRYTVKLLSEDAINEVCEKIFKSNYEIKELSIDHEFIGQIKSKNDEKYEKFVEDFVGSTNDKTISDLSPREKGVVKKIINEERTKRQSAIDERNFADKQTEITKEELSIEKKKGLYLLATRRTLSEDADGLIHTMKINNIEIKEGIDILIDGITTGSLSDKEMITRLGNIKLYAMKTLKMAELATRSGFDKDIEIRNVDIVKYIVEYIGIYKSTFSQDDVEFDFIIDNSKFQRSISVLNLSIVIDNLISNAIKWGGNYIRFKFSNPTVNSLEINISDSGYGLSENLINHSDSIFDLGVREEPPEEIGGSGVGLYFSRKLLSEMNASISFVGNNKDLQGATFKVVFE